MYRTTTWHKDRGQVARSLLPWRNLRGRCVQLVMNRKSPEASARQPVGRQVATRMIVGAII